MSWLLSKSLGWQSLICHKLRPELLGGFIFDILSLLSSSDSGSRKRFHKGLRSLQNAIKNTVVVAVLPVALRIVQTVVTTVVNLVILVRLMIQRDRQNAL